MTEAFKTYVLDILSVLLPGGIMLLVFFQTIWFTSTLHAIIIPQIDKEWVGVLLFGGASYFIGHLIFSVSSLLDDLLYDRVKFKIWPEAEKLAQLVIKLRNEHSGVNDGKLLNPFKWSCAYLLVKNPAGYAIVERYIAESKFFRSLVVVSLISAFIFGFDYGGNGEYKWSLVVLCLLVLCGSIWRYLTQRHKHVTTAYEFAIVIASEEKKPDQDVPYEKLPFWERLLCVIFPTEKP